MEPRRVTRRPVPRITLGYACINEHLRPKGIFASRTLRLETFKEKGLDYVKSLVLQNIADLKTIIEWNEQHGIRMFRYPNDLDTSRSNPQAYPYCDCSDLADKPKVVPRAVYSLRFAKRELEEVGALIRQYGHRVTFHTPQMCVLSSPIQRVAENCAFELGSHAELMDMMGLSDDGIIIIHGGGEYGDKVGTLERLERNFKLLSPAARRRLVLENDEHIYTVEDLLPVCRRLGIPLLMDAFHHSINPGTGDTRELVRSVLETWRRRGLKPKFHLSEQEPGAKVGAHSRFVRRIPDYLLQASTKMPIDIMIEAKRKDYAVESLHKRLFERVVYYDKNIGRDRIYYLI